MTGAKAIGVPGWPEFACCTASMDKVRMVFMQTSTIELSLIGAESSLADSALCLAIAPMLSFDFGAPIPRRIVVDGGAPSRSDIMVP